MQEGVAEGKTPYDFFYGSRNKIPSYESRLGCMNQGWASASLMRLYSRIDEVHRKMPIQEERLWKAGESY
jgi:glycogen debranching enzyme